MANTIAAQHLRVSMLTLACTAQPLFISKTQNIYLFMFAAQKVCDFLLLLLETLNPLTGS